MIPHSLDLSPSRSLQLAKYAKCSLNFRKLRHRFSLYGSGQIFERTKTCTDPPFVYTTPAEFRSVSWPDQKMISSRVIT